MNIKLCHRHISTFLLRINLYVYYTPVSIETLQKTNRCGRTTKFHPEHPFRGIYFFQIRGWSLVLQMFMMDIWLFPLRQNRSKHE